MRKDGGSPCWLLGDHLGSTSLVYNESQTIRQGYKAWREMRFILGAEELPTTFRYTGQREEASIGLYYYGARWYDPVLGRFTQADSIVPLAQQGVQAWDRYAYVNNNPINFIDPSGKQIPLIDGLYSVEYAVNHANEKGTCPNGQEPGGFDSIGEFIKFIKALSNSNQKSFSSSFPDEDYWSWWWYEYITNPYVLSDMATKVQDSATTVSTTGAAVEVIFITAGCTKGTKGCTIGFIVGNYYYMVVFNTPETILSFTSLGLTVASDMVAGNTTFVPLKVGEATTTSFVTAITGFLVNIGPIDALIDNYASSYAHGTLPGLYDLWESLTGY